MVNSIQTNWIIFTGSLSAGKTSVLNIFATKGFRCIPEVARSYIDREFSKGRTIEEIRSDEAVFQKALVAEKL